VTLERISGHRDGDATSCPGDSLYAQLPDLRVRAARYAGPIAGISMSAAEAVVRAPAPFDFSGTLQFADGPAGAGTTVDIEFQSHGTAEWRAIASAVTAADGSWAAAPELPGSGAVRASFTGSGTQAAMTSSLVDVWVLPRVALQRLRRVRPGARVRVTGTVTPRPVQRAIITFERRIGGRWVPIRQRRIRVTDGVIDFTVRPRSAGFHRVTVSSDGTVVRRTFPASWRVRATGGMQA
jgi:hypothetical protein